MSILKTFRAKFVLATVLLIALTQVFYVVQIYRDTSSINKDIYTETNERQREFVSYQFDNAFENILTLSDMLVNYNFSRYSIDNYNLRDQDEAELIRSILNSDINDLKIDNESIHSVFYIGRNYNQKNFAKVISQSDALDVEIPYMDELTSVGILPIISGEVKLPQYIRKGQLTSILELSKDKLSEEEYNKIESFCEMLEGHYIYPAFVNWEGKSLMILKLNPNFYQNLFSDIDDQEIKITVADEDEGVIWSSYSRSEDQNSKLDRLFQNDDYKEYKTWKNIDAGFGKNTYMIYKEGHGFSILYDDKGAMLEQRDQSFLTFFLLVAAISLILSGAIAFSMSGFITAPLREITEKLTNFHGDKVLSKLSMERTFNNWFQAASLRVKIFVAMSITIILPSILLGFLYSGFLAENIQFKYEDVITNSSKQLGTRIKNSMNKFNVVNGMFPEDLLESKIFEQMWKGQLDYQVEIVKSIITQPIGVNDISYYVLLELDGTIQYQSSYAGNTEIFSITRSRILQDFADQEDDTFWYTMDNPFFNRPLIALVKKVRQYEIGGSEVIGYLMMYINNDALDSVQTSGGISYMIEDRDGKIIFEKEASVYGSNIASTRQIKEIENEIVLFDPDWKLHVYRSMEDVEAIVDKMLFRTILFDICVVFASIVFASLLSRVLVSPLEAMKHSLAEVGGGNEFAPLKYDYNDEIGQLVDTYNVMIDRINMLMRVNTDQKIREQEMMTLKTQAEMNVLQQQINPHFLYNALEIINLHALRLGDETISKMAQTLAAFFRHSISSTGNIVTIEQEVELAKAYATIMEIRFKDKLSFIWDINDKTLSVPVLKLIIQPLIENAIKHGLNQMNSKGIIKVTTKIDDSKVYISVEDNGIGMDEEELEQLRSKLYNNMETGKDGEIRKKDGLGIGLGNVYNRLDLHYKGDFTFDVKSEVMGGTKFIIGVPR